MFKKVAALPVLLVVSAFIGISCGTTDSDEKKGSHFYVSIDGPSMNGEYNIDEGDGSTLNFTGLVYPATEDTPEIVILTFNNYNGLSVTFQVPAEERLTELTDNHQHFGMGITNTQEEIILFSKTVSIHVTLLDSNNFGITEMEANFEGVMAYKYFEDGNEIEEAHTVKGDFYFTQGTF